MVVKAAQFAGERTVRTVAIVVLLVALLVALLGPFGGSADGGLID